MDTSYSIIFEFLTISSNFKKYFHKKKKKIVCFRSKFLWTFYVFKTFDTDVTISRVFLILLSLTAINVIGNLIFFNAGGKKPTIWS